MNKNKSIFSELIPTKIGYTISCKEFKPCIDIILLNIQYYFFCIDKYKLKVHKDFSFFIYRNKKEVFKCTNEFGSSEYQDILINFLKTYKDILAYYSKDKDNKLTQNCPGIKLVDLYLKNRYSFETFQLTFQNAIHTKKNFLRGYVEYKDSNLIVNTVYSNQNKFKSSSSKYNDKNLTISAENLNNFNFKDESFKQKSNLNLLNIEQTILNQKVNNFSSFSKINEKDNNLNYNNMETTNLKFINSKQTNYNSKLSKDIISSTDSSKIITDNYDSLNLQIFLETLNHYKLNLTNYTFNENYNSNIKYHDILNSSENVLINYNNSVKNLSEYNRNNISNDFFLMCKHLLNDKFINNQLIKFEYLNECCKYEKKIQFIIKRGNIINTSKNILNHTKLINSINNTNDLLHILNNNNITIEKLNLSKKEVKFFNLKKNHSKILELRELQKYKQLEEKCKTFYDSKQNLSFCSYLNSSCVLSSTDLQNKDIKIYKISSKQYAIFILIGILISFFILIGYKLMKYFFQKKKSKKTLQYELINSKVNI